MPFVSRLELALGWLAVREACWNGQTFAAENSKSGRQAETVNARQRQPQTALCSTLNSCHNSPGRNTPCFRHFPTALPIAFICMERGTEFRHRLASFFQQSVGYFTLKGGLATVRTACLGFVLKLKGVNYRPYQNIVLFTEVVWLFRSGGSIKRSWKGTGQALFRR